MSISMTKAEGDTVLTLTSDLQGSPACCSVSQNLRRTQRTSLSVLGTMQIIVGLLNICLGIILLASTFMIIDVYILWYMHPFWLGALFVVFGTACILSEKCPCPCMVTANVILSLAGVAFAFTGIVFYSITIGNTNSMRSCDYWYGETATPPPAEEQRIIDECLRYLSSFQTLVTGNIAVLILLSLLELFVTISAFILGIKALMKLKGENEVKNEKSPTATLPCKTIDLQL